MLAAEVVRRGAAYLARHDVQSPEVSAEHLLMKVIGTDRSGLYTRRAGLSSAEARAYGRALCRRCVGVPLQHLTGEQGFRRLRLEVRPGVFVPRPETEVLVEVGLELIADTPAPIVADVCTGTGAVALAISDEHPGATVWAADASPLAVELARANAELLGLPVDVREGDLLDPLPPEIRGRLNLVTANPPYVEHDRFASLPPEVRADPIEALVGGVGVYERLFPQAYEWLAGGGHVAVEIGDDQASAITGAATAAGFAQVRIHADLGGRDRVVTARRP